MAREMAALAFIRAWIADDFDKGMLLLEQQNIPRVSHFRFVSSQGGEASSAVGDRYRVDEVLEVLDQGLENARGVPRDGLRSR
jgi:hypothetical protein